MVLILKLNVFVDSFFHRIKKRWIIWRLGTAFDYPESNKDFFTHFLILRMCENSKIFIIQLKIDTETSKLTFL